MPVDGEHTVTQASAADFTGVHLHSEIQISQFFVLFLHCLLYTRSVTTLPLSSRVAMT